MKVLLTFLVLTITISSCNKTVCPPNDFTSESIHKGVLGGAGDENIDQGNLVIKTQTEWSELLTKMNSVNNESDNFAITDVNFDTHMVIACFDPVHSSGGHEINIASILHDGSNILVDVQNTSDTSGFVITVLTQPYVLMMVTQCDEEVIFN
ncbi:MAG: hypothetical protein ACI857_001196 [Arenicella sp.]|jgi:hypothetical protein